ncbi:MAG: glycosyltransferase [Myxococcota bacterium]
MAAYVSVVMTVHNGAAYVAEACRSILAQTHRELELLVVDDGSEDATAEILRGITDPRLRCLRLDKPLGPFAAANRALDEAQGDLIARLDADDVAEVERVAAQVAYLEAHPEVGLLGSGATRIRADGTTLDTWRVPVSDVDIRFMSLLGCCLIHSSVMVRAELLRGAHERYREDPPVAGDYDLWTRLLPRTRAAALPEPLVRYRVWDGSISVRRRAEQERLHTAIARRWMAETLGLGATDEDVASLRTWLMTPAREPGSRSRVLWEDLSHRFAERVGPPPSFSDAAVLARPWVR